MGQRAFDMIDNVLYQSFPARPPPAPGNHIMPDHSPTCSRIAPSPMPPKPTWFHRLPEILDVLHSLDTSHLDRQGVEHLFGAGTDEDGN